MKLLVMTSLKDDRKIVAGILGKSGIAVFSMSETIGFKEHVDVNLLDNWFSSGKEEFDSIVVFSFTSDDNATRAMVEVKNYNVANETRFPIRAFVMDVERSSYA